MLHTCCDPTAMIDDYRADCVDATMAAYIGRAVQRTSIDGTSVCIARVHRRK